jgi:hypothetical protein
LSWIGENVAQVLFRWLDLDQPPWFLRGNILLKPAKTLFHGSTALTVVQNGP